MSLLSLVQDAMKLCGLAAPAIAFASQDATVQEFIAHSKVEGDELALRDWPQLEALSTLTGDGTSTTWDLPTDFARWLPGDQFWLDGSPGGPLQKVSGDEMLQLKAASATPARPVWRRFGDQIEFYPAPSTSQVIKSQYYSQYWIVDNGVTVRKIDWGADDDLSLLPLPIMKAGMIYRWKRSKGLDYGDYEDEYERIKKITFAHQDGRANISIPSGYPSDGPCNVSDPFVTVV